MLLLKTVNVKNKANVLVQIPKAIASHNWNLHDGDKLEVFFDETSKQLIIKPTNVGGSANTTCK